MHVSIHMLRHDSFMSQTWLIRRNLPYVSIRISVCTYMFTCWDMTHSCLRHDSLKAICPTSRFAYLYAHMYPFAEIWLIHMWNVIQNMTDSYMKHESFHECTTLFTCRYKWVMTHLWMSHVSHVHEFCLTYQWVMSHIWIRRDAVCIFKYKNMGWLRLVGFWKW